MIYRLNNKNLHLLNPLDTSEVNIDLSMFKSIDDFQFVLNKNNDRIAFSVNNDGANGLYVMNFIEKNYRNIYQGQFYDFTWLNDSDLIINTGKEICKLNVDNGNLKKLYKFSRTEMAPLSLLANDEGTKIMALINDKPFVYDLINQEVVKIPFKITNYCWFNNEEILYSYQNGIKGFNVVTGKKFNFIPTFKTLNKIPGFSEDFDEYRFNDFEFNIVEPKFFGNLVFFKVEVLFWDSDEAISAVLSVDLDKTKVQLHYMCRKGFFNFYEPMLNGEVISILGIPKEKVSTKLIHSKSVLNYIRYYPSPNALIPSHTFSYQSYYES